MSELLQGDALTVLRTLPGESVQCCVTSPPYWGLRDYGVDGQIGREADPGDFIAALVGVFREVRRVLREDGVLWLNLGDTYANDAKWGGATGGKHVSALHGNAGVGRGKRVTGLPPKSLMMMPARVAIAMQADGWTLRSDVIWHKPNPMPESVSDRPTLSHEHVFMLVRSPKYFYDIDSTRVPHKPESLARYEYGLNCSAPDDGLNSAGARNPRALAHAERMGDNVNPAGRNSRSVWTVPTESFDGAHFATFPQALVRRCVLASSRVGDTVLDPFAGSGTTCVVADTHQRAFIGIELNPDYVALARRRIYRDGAPLFGGVST